MGYLDTLIELKEKVSSSNFSPNHKILLIDLIQKERSRSSAIDDAFIYFYTDILNATDIFDYSSVLMNYEQAKEHAVVCISIFNDFASLEEDQRLQSWLQSAIRVVDCIVIHYLQEVLQEEPVPQGDAGAERSRYIQINRRGVRAERAGRIMDHLYDQRNKMEHVTKTDPGDPKKQILLPPKYNKIKRKIQKRFPQALENFNEAFTEYY